MANAFGVGDVEVVPTLSSGLPAWKHEVRLKDGQIVRFVPLHAVKEGMGVWVHLKKLNLGEGYKYIPVGSKNKHLFTPVNSPFEASPDKEISATKVTNFMIVFVLEGAEDLNGHVGFVELRANMKRNGSYDKFLLWESEAKDSVANKKCSIQRTGSSLKDTVYQSTVVGPYKLTKEQEEIVAREKPEVIDYLLENYRNWTEDKFNEAFAKFMETQAKSASKPELETETEEAGKPFGKDEIPF